MKIRSTVPAFGLVFLISGMAAAGDLKGRLLLGDRPAAGVTVLAVPHEEPFEAARRQARREPRPQPLATTSSRQDGTFTLTVPAKPGAAAAVRFSLETQGGGTVPTRFDGVWDTSESEDLGDAVLTKGAALSGKVVDAEGRPVEGAEVVLTGDDDSRPASAARTPADGTFRFDDAAPFVNNVWVEKQGLSPAAVNRARAGKLASIVLVPGLPLHGSVRHPDGRTAAAGALVRFEAAGTGTAGAATRWVEVAGDGAFTIPAVPDEVGRLRADAAEHGFRELTNLDPRLLAPTGQKALSVKLVAAAALEGRAVDSRTGKALPRVKVEVRGAAGTKLVRSGPDGKYRLHPLPAGAYRLRADEPRYVPYTRRDVAVRAGEVASVDLPLVLGASISGKVVDEDGQPVAAAEGRFQRGGGNVFAGLRREGRGADFRSAADGTFKASRLSPGDNQDLVVAHPQHERARLGGVSLSPGALKANVQIVLRRGLTLTGRVLDGEDKPVAGASVELQGGGFFRQGRGGMAIAAVNAAGGDRPRAESDSAGRFELKGLSAGEYRLVVEKSGYATETLDGFKLASEKSPEPLEVRLAPGASITGWVRRKDGTGAEGYIVTTGNLRGGLRGGGRDRGPQTTGADGAFTLDGLRQGQSYDLAVLSATGPGPQKKGVLAPSSDVELQVPSVGTIAGVAMEAESGRPITDFTVTHSPAAMGPGGGQVIRVLTRAGGRMAGAAAPVEVHSEDGAFLLENVAPGSWEVTVEAKGFQRSRATVKLEEGENKEGVEVKVRREALLSGRVVDGRSGRAVPGAAVQVQAATGGGGAAMLRLPGLSQDEEVVTDAEGRFQVGGLGAGKYQVTASHADYTDATETVELAEDKGAVAELKLKSGGVLGGVVLDAARRGIAGVDVSLSPSGEAGFRGFAGQTALTDEGGRFRFDHLAAGRYDVSASARGRTAKPVNTVLQEGESREDVVLSLAGGTTVRGVVTGLAEGDRSGVNVTAQGAEAFFASSRTDGTGRFEIEGVPAGPVTLRAMAGGLGTMRNAEKLLTLNGNEPDVETEIVFEGGFTLSGRVTRRGEPAAGAAIGANPQGGGGGRMAFTTTDESGAYTIEGLKEGTYTVSATLTSSGASKRETVTIKGDQSLDLDLPSASLSGLVVEQGTRRPLSDARVEVAGGGAGPFRTMVTTDSSGRFSVQGLDEKSYTLTVNRAGFQVEKRSASASESGGDETVIELARGEGISLKARDGLYNLPLRSLYARATDSAGTPVFSGTVALDSEGRGEIPSLKPGSYTLFLDSSGYAPVTTTVQVPSSNLTLTFTPGGTVEIRSGEKTLARGMVTAQLLTAAGTPYGFSMFGPEGRVSLSSPVRRLENLTPGGYVLQVSGGEAKSFSVTEGGVTVVELP